MGPGRAITAAPGFDALEVPSRGRQLAQKGYPLGPPGPVGRAALIHRWTQLGLVHWRFDPEEVAPLLPPGIEPDVFDGSAWVGLVPFHCTIRPPFVPRIPWASSFPEMNVRTYVRGPQGPGVWFISLESARLGAVLIARATYGLRYFWARMAFSRVGDVVTYRSRRRWPGRRGAAGSLAIALDEEIGLTERDPLEAFLTNRWRFYCSAPIGVATGTIEHEPWPLRRGRLLHCDPGLVAECGLPEPAGEPLVHFSDGVDVRMSALHRIYPAARLTSSRTASP